jgi:hypothetical protein
LGVSRQVLQTASQALLLFDLKEYDICISVKNAPDKKTRKEYYHRMMDYKFKAQPVRDAMVALAMNPSSEKLMNSIIQALSPIVGTAVEIEKSKLASKTLTTESVSDNSIEIGATSFEQKLQDLRGSGFYIGEDISEKERFYYEVIYKLDKMLANPRFIRISDPEDSNKVHDTLVEIDRLMEKNYVERQVTLQYRQFRGPWEDFYTNDPKKRAEFARLVRDFRNKLVENYNNKILPVYNEKSPEKRDKIEIDTKEYKIEG